MVGLFTYIYTVYAFFSWFAPDTPPLRLKWKNVKYMYEKKYNNKVHKISKHLPYNFTNNIEYEDVTYVYHEDDYYLVNGVFKNTEIQRVLSISELRVL